MATSRIDDQPKPPAPPSRTWRKEQEAKREAYEAKRRAWMRQFESVEDETAMAPALIAGTSSPARRKRRTSRKLADVRQSALSFSKSDSV